jgi:hypothetical protein
VLGSDNSKTQTGNFSPHFYSSTGKNDTISQTISTSFQSDQGPLATMVPRRLDLVLLLYVFVGEILPANFVVGRAIHPREALRKRRNVKGYLGRMLETNRVQTWEGVRAHSSNCDDITAIVSKQSGDSNLRGSKNNKQDLIDPPEVNTLRDENDDTVARYLQRNKGGRSNEFARANTLTSNQVRHGKKAKGQRWSNKKSPVGRPHGQGNGRGNVFIQIVDDSSSSSSDDGASPALPPPTPTINVPLAPILPARIPAPPGPSSPTALSGPSGGPPAGFVGSSCFREFKLDYFQLPALQEPVDSNPVFVDYSDPNEQALGTVYVYNDVLLNQTTLAELNTSFVTGHCTRFQDRRNVTGGNFISGGGLCHFSFSLFDGQETSTLIVAGEIFDGFGGSLTITGGSKSFLGAVGQVVLSPVSVNNDGTFMNADSDVFMGVDGYLMNAAILVNECAQTAISSRRRY